MAAYGLYSHIQSNRRRSVALLIGLFFLVYLLVFAGALLAEALTVDAPIEYLVHAALYDLIKAFPFATIGTIIWVLTAYKFHQSMIDAVTGGHEVTLRRGTAPLQSSGKSLHFAWHHHAKAEDRR